MDTTSGRFVLAPEQPRKRGFSLASSMVVVAMIAMALASLDWAAFERPPIAWVMVYPALQATTATSNGRMSPLPLDSPEGLDRSSREALRKVKVTRVEGTHLVRIAASTGSVADVNRVAAAIVRFRSPGSMRILALARPPKPDYWAGAKSATWRVALAIASLFAIRWVYRLMLGRFSLGPKVRIVMVPSYDPQR